MTYNPALRPFNPDAFDGAPSNVLPFPAMAMLAAVSADASAPVVEPLPYPRESSPGEPHFPQEAFGDASSYTAQHPRWEPYIDDLIDATDTNTPSGAMQNLLYTLGKQTVRQRSLDPVTAKIDGKACAVCGVRYATPSHTTRLVAWDRMMAPWGGAEENGRANCSWGTLRHPVITISSKLPDAVAAMLSVGGITWTVRLTSRDSLDGDYAWTVSGATERKAYVGGKWITVSALLLRGTAFATSHRHTASIHLQAAKIAKYAEKLPVQIAKHAAALQHMHGTPLALDDVKALCLLIANGGKQPKAKKPGAKVKRTAKDTMIDTLVDLVVKADGTLIPLAPEAGTFSALQVFEAACVYESQHRTVRDTGIADRGEHDLGFTSPAEALARAEKIVRLNRVLSGKTVGDVAFGMLHSAKAYAATLATLATPVAPFDVDAEDTDEDEDESDEG